MGRAVLCTAGYDSAGWWQWHLPVQAKCWGTRIDPYTSKVMLGRDIIPEHNAVRSAAGLRRVPSLSVVCVLGFVARNSYPMSKSCSATTSTWGPHLCRYLVYECGMLVARKCRVRRHLTVVLKSSVASVLVNLRVWVCRLCSCCFACVLPQLDGAASSSSLARAAFLHCQRGPISAAAFGFAPACALFFALWFSFELLQVSMPRRLQMPWSKG